MTLKAYTGSRNKQAASFKRQVRAALEQLVAVGFLVSYEIHGDAIEVCRVVPSLKRA